VPSISKITISSFIGCRIFSISAALAFLFVTALQRRDSSALVHALL
jgi:hypothetical protein